MLFGSKIRELRDKQGLLHQDEDEMLKLWLADKVLDVVEGEDKLSNDAST